MGNNNTNDKRIQTDLIPLLEVIFRPGRQGRKDGSHEEPVYFLEEETGIWRRS